MGMILREDDVHIPDFVNLFNARFAPVQQAKSNPGQPPAGMWHAPAADDSQTPQDESLYGGIAEMVALQREFEIFRADRPFWKSAALLGLGGVTNHRAKNRWLALLKWAGTLDSDKPGVKGDQRIINALIANLAKPEPLPCYMTVHDLRKDDAHRVIVRENDTPLFYFHGHKFLTISLPMAPKPSAASGSPPPSPSSPRPARRKAARPAASAPTSAAATSAPSMGASPTSAPSTGAPAANAPTGAAASVRSAAAPKRPSRPARPKT